MNRFQTGLESAHPSIHSFSLPRVSHQQITHTFKQYFHFKLPKGFVAQPIPETKDELTLHANDSEQNLYFDDFCSCFNELLNAKYGHLDEADLFGDNEKPGVIFADFETSLETCTQLEHYQEFFTRQFCQHEGVINLQKQFKQWYEVFIIACKPEQIQQEILNLVITFSYFLIDTRMQAVEMFEQYERGFHSELRSYSKFNNIINSKITSKLNEIAKHFEKKVRHLKAAVIKSSDLQGKSSPIVGRSTEDHALLEIINTLSEVHQKCPVGTTLKAQQMRAEILKVEIKLYMEVLKVLDINQKAGEQVKQCLNSSTNHYAYLHEHLDNLCELLRMIINPYKVTYETKDGHSVYTVAMAVGSISGALSAFSEWLESDSNSSKLSLREGDKLRLCSDSVLYLDSDMRYDYLTFQGVSVALMSPKMSLEKEGKIVINTDGKELANVHQDQDATSGRDGTKDEKDGEPGKDGENGFYGNAGGHILVVSSNLCWDDFDLSAKGSHGQDGQNGGNGGDGWTPPKELEGRDAEDPQFEPGRFENQDSVVLWYGTFGQSGGQGGDAGMGGAAGKSGISGKIEIIDLEDETHCKSFQEKIENGQPGEPGRVGRGGKHARHGRDWGKYASTLSFGGKFVTFFTTTRPDDSIQSVKGELEHSAIEKKSGSGEHFEKSGKGLPRQRKQEDHPDFIDRGSNRDGRAAQVKINTAVANENKAIDKNACLMAMISQCGQTRNHWNEKSHHSFLKVFASKIDASYQGRYMTMTRSARIKVGKAAWIDHIQKLAGKTEVAVSYSRHQTQRASVQLMKNLEERQAFSRSVSYMSSETDIDVKPVYIDLSAFKDRAEQRGVTCNNLLLDLFLTSDKHDDYMEHLITDLNLSAVYVHVVVVSNIEKATELASKYVFLIVKIKDGSQNLTLFYCNHTKQPIPIVNSPQLVQSLDELDLKLEKPESLKSFILYEDVLQWIASTLGTETSTALPCSHEQMHCKEQLELVIFIRRSYQGLYKLCDETSLHLFQSVYAKFLYQVLEADSFVFTGSLELIHASLEMAEKYFLIPIDISWLEENIASSSQQALAKLTTAVNLYNKGYNLKQLMTVIKAFLNYHRFCCRSGKEVYVSFLSQESTLSALKNFTNTLKCALELFGTRKVELPDMNFEYSTIQEILQRVAIPSLAHEKLESYASAEATLHAIVTYSKSIDVSTDVDSTLNILKETIQFLWDIKLSARTLGPTFLPKKETFEQKCKVFRSKPSLKELYKVMQAYSDQKPLLSDCKDDLKYLLEFTFSQINQCLQGVKRDAPLSAFVSSLDISMVDLEQLNEAIKTIPEDFSQAHALHFLLERLQALLSMAVKVDSEIQLMDLNTLLVTVSKMLKEMSEFYYKLMYIPRTDEEKKSYVLKWIPIDGRRIGALTATLLQYPMSCPTTTILNWVSFVKEKVSEIVPLRIKLYKGKKDTEDVKILEGLETLSEELKAFVEKLSSLGKVRQDLDLVIFAGKLSLYTELRLKTRHNHELAEAVPQVCLNLDESLIEAGFLKCFSEWLKPGLLGLSRSDIAIDMKRLAPQQNVLVLSKEPKEISANTIILLATDNGGWKTCSVDTSSTTESYQYRDVIPDDISGILGTDAHRTVTSSGEMKLTKEQQAKILGKLSFEDEFSVICNVQYCGQTIISENCDSTTFLRVEIDLATNNIQLLREIPTDKEYTDEKTEITFVHSSNLDGLNLPNVHTQKEELLQRKAFLCILKYPSKPSEVFVESVTNCGDHVRLNFCHSPPLAIAADVSHCTTSSFIEQVQPIVSLLNGYQELYHSYLPKEKLQRNLNDRLKHCKEPVFKTDIAYLVTLIRKNFIKTICGDTHEDDLRNLKVILDVEKKETSDKSLFIKGLLLTGLELFLCFILVERKPQHKSSNRVPQQNSDICRFHMLWQYVSRGTNLSESEAESLLVAFAYLKDHHTVDDGLKCESAEARTQAYSMIKEGLLMFDIQVHRNEALASEINSLLDSIYSFLKKYSIEVFWECSQQLVDDDRNLSSLLALVHSTEVLTQQVMQLDSLSDISTDNDTCRRLLESDSFFVELANIVFMWCTNQLHSLFQEFQFAIAKVQVLVISDIENAISTFTSWIMEEMKIAFAQNNWENIQHYVRITNALVMETYSLLVEAPLTKEECPELIQDLSIIIKTIKVSDDLAEVTFILENDLSEYWLKHLIASNLLTVLQHYYQMTVSDDLCDQLLLLDSKLLRIFYNVFVTDQYNLTSDSQQRDLAGFVSLEQISTVLNWLCLIEPCPSANTVLCRTSLALWEKELIEIYFKQYIDHWNEISEADKQKTVYLMNRVRLDTGVSNKDFIALLCTVRRKYIKCSKSYQTPAVFLEMFEDLYYGRVSLSKVEAIVNGYEYVHWSEQIEKIKRKKRDQYDPRSVNTVLEMVKAQILADEYDITMEQFEVIKTEAEQIVYLVQQQMDNDSEAEHVSDSTSEVDSTSEAESVSISKLDEEYFSLLRRNGSISEKKEWLENKDHRVKFVANLVIVWILTTSATGQKQVPYNTQIVSLLLFLHANDSGLLQQVKTGEGKTLVVAMLAAAKALLGYHVDIVSSNRDLAQDGMRKCQPFFSSLGLQAAVNCTEDDDTNQQAYKSHIVYGDVGSFQRDVLTEESKPGGTSFSARCSDPSTNCLIVDEVDSMFLDKGQHMLYLSHETAALKHLETLFIMIWSAVLSVSEESENQKLPVGEVICQLALKLSVLIDNGTISVPQYLTDFCKKKLKSWVKSAYEARLMNANDQFIIDSRSKGSHVKQIFPIDKQTGIEQYNMKWTDGLSQFLELKYQRPLSTESLRAVFISNKRFFKRYDRQLFGLTGTLGSVSSRSLLQSVYNIKTVEIPTNRPKRYIQTKSRVAETGKMWCDLIKQEVYLTIKLQPVLIICENIKQLSSVKNSLKFDSTIQVVEDIAHFEQTAKLAIEIIDYARDGDDVEKRFHKQGAHPGQLILATNKGGRGTDIKVDEVKAPTGLHVILSFLPENTRIEEQAFGRAARAGQAGSGCLITQINPTECQEMLATFETLEAATETIIEIEKIKRNRGETERLTLLLNEGIPKLDMEEKLYTSFQEHRLALTSVLDKAAMFEVSVEGTKHIKNACQAIITNHWAFWLESMRAQIRSADTPEKRLEIMSIFKEEFPCEGLSVPSSGPDSKFFKMPEDYIQLGRAYLKEIDYLRVSQKKVGNDLTKSMYTAALTCFERAKDEGDRTGLAAMTACYCFIKLKQEATDENKKEVRRYLKVARSHLITLKQGWMGNVEISKSLAGLVDVSQYVEESENHYAQQIEGKLKVIGLHLHIIETLLGNSIEESSFVNESSLKVETISLERSQKLYQSLCADGIICHNKVRSCWKNREKLESLIKRDVESTIADDLIELILEKPTISEDDLTELVYSSDELWDILESLKEQSQVVMVIKVEQINEKLSTEELVNSWQTVHYTMCSGSDARAQSVLPSDDPIYKKLQKEEYLELTSYLRSNGLCIDTRRGKLKSDAYTQIETVDLGKFEGCKVSDGAGTEQSLREFLADFLNYCNKEEDGYIYEHMLPFGKRSQEAKKLHAFLQEHDILKSGELAAHKYDRGSDKFTASVKKTLAKDFTKAQTAFILDALKGLKGEVRKFERRMQVEFVSFYDLKDHPEDVPEELDFFTVWHMDHFLSVDQEDKGWWDWNAFACAMIGLAQVVAGVAFVTLTTGLGAQVGFGLISEGINDMAYATMAGLAGTFSWKDYAIQKAISVMLTVATGGLGALATPLKVATKVGSAARFSTFIRTAAKAAGDFALGAITSILSDVVLADVQRRVVEALGNYITGNLFPLVRDKIRSKLIQIARESEDDDEFHRRSETVLDDLASALEMERSKFSVVFDQLRSQVVSLLAQHCRGIADNLCKSNSKWAKLVGTGAKVAFFADKIFTLVQGGIRIALAANQLVSLIFTEQETSDLKLRSENDINMNLVDQELDMIESHFKELIHRQLEDKIRLALNIAIRKSLKLIAIATKHLVKTSVEKAFNGRKTSELVKEMQAKKATVMREHVDDAYEEPSTIPTREFDSTLMDSAEKKQRAFIKQRDNFQDSIVEPCRIQQNTVTTATPSIAVDVSGVKATAGLGDQDTKQSTIQPQAAKTRPDRPRIRKRTAKRAHHVRRRHSQAACHALMSQRPAVARYYSRAGRFGN